MKRINAIPFIGCLILCIGTTRAQEHPVAAGTSSIGPNGSISFSIGQIVYINMSNHTMKITQGVQQPFEMLVYPGDKPIIIDLSKEFELFPNPARDYTVLNIKEGSPDNLSYMIYDMLGRILTRERLVDVRTTIPMDKYPSAVYILTVVENSTNKIITTFKIVKIL